MATTNAKAALSIYLSDKANYLQRMTALQQALHLAFLPQRIECFDISHSSGEATVASCVVFTPEGPDKASYRRFNITNITPGDDYGALREAIRRRYAKVKEEGRVLPDVILIDGGKGQLHQAEIILEELQVSGVQLFSIAKGPGRKAGLETIYQSEVTQPFHLAPDALGMHALQHIRDEAHRFAISGHQRKRDKARKTSLLEGIAGIGKKRRQQLLNYFGGLQTIKTASVEQLQQVPGISHDLAVKIHDYFHR